MNTIIERDMPEGAWKDLLPHALSIIEDIEHHEHPIHFGLLVVVRC